MAQKLGIGKVLRFPFQSWNTWRLDGRAQRASSSSSGQDNHIGAEEEANAVKYQGLLQLRGFYEQKVNRPLEIHRTGEEEYYVSNKVKLEDQMVSASFEPEKPPAALTVESRQDKRLDDGNLESGNIKQGQDSEEASQLSQSGIALDIKSEDETNLDASNKPKESPSLSFPDQLTKGNEEMQQVAEISAFKPETDRNEVDDDLQLMPKPAKYTHLKQSERQRRQQAEKNKEMRSYLALKSRESPTSFDAAEVREDHKYNIDKREDVFRPATRRKRETEPQLMRLSTFFASYNFVPPQSQSHETDFQLLDVSLLQKKKMPIKLPFQPHKKTDEPKPTTDDDPIDAFQHIKEQDNQNEDSEFKLMDMSVLYAHLPPQKEEEHVLVQEPATQFPPSATTERRKTANRGRKLRLSEELRKAGCFQVDPFNPTLDGLQKELMPIIKQVKLSPFMSTRKARPTSHFGSSRSIQYDSFNASKSPRL